MLISPALAHGTKGSEISGGGVALLIILGVAILFGLICLGLKRWRRRKLEPGGDGVYPLQGMLSQVPDASLIRPQE